MSDSASSSTDHPRPDEDGWEDAEEDQEDIVVVSLFDDKTFKSVQEMLAHCKDEHGFDFTAVQAELKLDFYDRIRLVNYIRSQVKAGVSKPDVSTKDVFADEKYLQPVLEDDAFLFGLDDVDGGEVADPGATSHVDESSDDKIKRLEDELRRTRLMFRDYQTEVQSVLQERLRDMDIGDKAEQTSAGSQKENRDEHYFESYSYNGKSYRYWSPKMS